MQQIEFKDYGKSKLRTLGVVSLYLFGSHAEGVATEKSDYDFAVLMSDASLVKPGRSTQELYQQLYESLAPICLKDVANQVVDIIFLQSGVSLELQANVVEFGKLLLDDDPELRANYEEQVMLRMADIRPILDEMDKTILERI